MQQALDERVAWHLPNNSQGAELRAISAKIGDWSAIGQAQVLSRFHC
jgi:hypothetical protein